MGGTPGTSSISRWYFALYTIHVGIPPCMESPIFFQIISNLSICVPPPSDDCSYHEPGGIRADPAIFENL